MYDLLRDIYSRTNDFMNKDVVVGGWIRTLRDNKNFGFIELNDGTFFKSVQVVFNNDLDNYNKISHLGVGASVTVKGVVVESIGNKQTFEIKAKEVIIEGECPSEYPLQKKRHSMEFLRTIAHLRPRTNTFAAAFRVRSLTAFAIHKFFNEEYGFVYVHTPIITGSDAEGAGEMFKLTTLDLEKVPRTEEDRVDYSKDFFGKTSALTVSGQLNAEAFATAFRNVYTFGPTFRAENSNTTRHACEFWMIEPEIAFADLNDCMNLAEAMMKYIVKYVLENASDEIEFFNSFVDNTLKERLLNLVDSDFIRITYTEALELLSKADVKFEYKPEWGLELQTEHEKYLTEQIFKKPVFVKDYPKDVKAFYMRQNEDGKTVAACDLLVPGIGEIIGGSQREERLEFLEKRMDEMGMNKEDYWWYLDLRRYGSVKHSGYGLGFERCIMYITGISNIRDVLPFPRTPNNLEF